MMKWRFIGVSLVACALGAGLGLWVLDFRSANAARGNLTSDYRSPQAVPSQPSGPMVIVLRQETSATPSTTVREAPPAVVPVTPEELVAQLDLTFQQEPRCAAGRELERTILSEFEAPDIRGVQVETMECRTSRCRIELTFDDLAADKRVMSQVFLSANSKIPPGMIAAAPLRDTLADGKRRVTMFLYPSEGTSESSDGGG